VAGVNFEYGRLLGSNGVPSNPNFTNTRIYAIANGQPSLVPVLQIQPRGPPSAGSRSGGAEIQNRWLQAAGATLPLMLFCVVAAPSRPAEESAGLHNFVRFLEDGGNTLNIRGGFVQAQCLRHRTVRNFLLLQSDDDDGSVSILDTLSLNIKRLTVHPGTLPTTVTDSAVGFDDGDFVSVSILVKYSLNSLRLLLTRFFRKLVEMTFGFKGFMLLKAQGLTLSPSIKVNVPTLLVIIVHPLVLITVNSAWF